MYIFIVNYYKLFDVLACLFKNLNDIVINWCWLLGNINHDCNLKNTTSQWGCLGFQNGSLTFNCVGLLCV